MKKILFPILATVLIAFAIMPLAAETVFANTIVDEQGVEYTLNDANHTAVVSGCTNNLQDSVDIPRSVSGCTVTSIGTSAFQGCENLISITLPESVTSIGELAFQGCGNLTNVTIPASMRYIAESAFQGCGNHLNITIPAGATSIGEGAFENCSGLTTITIPASVTSIGSSAFKASGLTTITFENESKLRSIGTSTFQGCKNLTSITIPASVTSIGGLAFKESGLTTITFENESGLESIGSLEFQNCGSLTSITIPKYVTYIGDGAFRASGLTTITFENGIKLNTIEENAFYGCVSLTSITIPASVTKILNSAFKDSGLALIHYLGNETAWNSVTKDNNWAPSNPAVHCVPNKTTRKATPDADGGIDRYLCDEAGCGDWGYEGTVIRRPVISLSETSFDYDGTVKKPEVSVEDTAGQTIAVSNYDVTIRNRAGTVVTEPVEAGNYTVAVQMKGDSYSGTKELAYSIKKSIQDAEVVLSATAYSYNGTVQKPTIGTIGGMDLTEGTDYTAVWSNASSVNAGTYTVTITGKDFYTGTTTASYKIDPKAVTVKANNASKTYGKNDPAKFTATVSGLVGTDTLTYTVAREPGEDAGTYAIIPTGEAVQGNYAVTYEDGTFTIDPKTVIVKADNASKTYGKNDPAQFTATVSGLLGTDTIKYTVAREKGNNVGKYAIIPTGEVAQGNYAVTYENGIFTINKAANTMKIKAKTTTVKGSTKGKKGTLKKTKTLGVTKVIKFTNKGQGAKTYVKKSGNKKITIAKTTGKVTVKKGLKKGTYNVKVKVKAKGNANYKVSAWKTVTFKITVK